MLLTYANSEPFAIGASGYFYHPAGGDVNNRIVLQVELEGVMITAVVDTGAPYVVCAPDDAKRVGIHPNSDMPHIELNIRGIPYDGHLHRLRLTFVASEGKSVNVDATVFVPDARASEKWRKDIPSFIGLTGCLERMRFAVDPGNDSFYFGPLSGDLVL